MLVIELLIHDRWGCPLRHRSRGRHHCVVDGVNFDVDFAHEHDAGRTAVAADGVAVVPFVVEIDVEDGARNIRGDGMAKFVPQPYRRPNDRGRAIAGGNS